MVPLVLLSPPPHPASRTDAISSVASFLTTKPPYLRQRYAIYVSRCGGPIMACGSCYGRNHHGELTYDLPAPEASHARRASHISLSAVVVCLSICPRMTSPRCTATGTCWTACR